MSVFLEKIEKSVNKKTKLIETNFIKYSIKSMLAGAMLTLSTLAGVVASDSLNTIHPSLGKFMYAFLFSFGLIYILFLNFELATSNMMYLTAGLYLKKNSLGQMIKILLVCTIFNLIGAMAISLIINQSSVMHGLSESSQLVQIVEAKLSHGSMDIFFGAIVANILVNIAILAYLLVGSWSAEIPIILSAIFMFVYLGLDHVVANFGSFSLIMFSEYSSQMDGFNILNILRQWTWAFLGNFVGGGLIIGLTYAYMEKE